MRARRARGNRRATTGGVPIDEVTVRDSGLQPSASDADGPRPAVAALAVGWQVAELAAAVADSSGSLSGQLLRAEPLVRTIEFRLRALELRDRDSVAVSAAPLAGLIGSAEPDRSAVLQAVLALHASTLHGLEATSPPGGPDLRHAYELGRALAQSALVAGLAADSVQPALYRRLFDAARLLTVAEWLARLRGELPDRAADAVFHSLRCWCGFVAGASDGQLLASGTALRAQSRIWRDLLFDRRSAVSLLAGRNPGSGEPPGSLEEIETISLDAAFTAGGGNLTVSPAEAGILRAATVLPPPAEGVELPTTAAVELPAATASPATVVAVDADGAGQAATLHPRPSRSRPPAWARRLASWLVVLVLALAITVLLRTFVVQPFSIPSGSMFPTLQVGDRILVDKLPPAVHSIHLGDIIVFRRVAADRVDPQTEDLVKRVVGLPGETISSQGNAVIIDGRPLSEPWLPPLVGDCAEQQLGIPRQRIPADSYFVLGDCRGISYDSRYWGTVPASHIIGKVVVVVWRDDHPWFHWF